MRKGRLFIVSGPSGCGKDTIISRVLEQNDRIRLSISTVTRAMREGERPDGKYHFVSREEFEQGLESGEFLEHNVYLDNYYGTPRRPVEQWLNEGLDVLLEIDVNGARTVRTNFPGTRSVFILPPAMHVLRERLSARGTEDSQTVEKRLREASREILCAKEYDYILVNDTVDQAVYDLNTIIRADALSCERMGEILNEVENDAQSCNW